MIYHTIFLILSNSIDSIDENYIGFNDLIITFQIHLRIIFKTSNYKF